MEEEIKVASFLQGKKKEKKKKKGLRLFARLPSRGEKAGLRGRGGRKGKKEPSSSPLEKKEGKKKATYDYLTKPLKKERETKNTRGRKKEKKKKKAQEDRKFPKTRSSLRRKKRE